MVAKTSKTSNTSKTTKTKKAVVESAPVEVEPETTPIDTTPIEVEAAPVAKPAKTKSTKSSKTTKTVATPAPAQPAAAPAKTTKSAKSAAPTPKKAKAAKKSEPVEEDEEPVESKPAKGEKPKGEKRTFMVVNVVDHDLDESTSKNGGRYIGNGPMQASKKAFGHLAKKLYGNDPCTIVFSIQECTRGSDKKVYPYTGERFKLETPQVINKGGNEYNISFKNVVKSVKPVKNQ